MNCAEHHHLWTCYWSRKVDDLTAEARRRRQAHELDWHLRAERCRADAVAALDLAVACERSGV